MKITLKEKIIYYFAKSLSLLSIQRSHNIGGFIGKLLYKFPNKIKFITNINLKKCFPNNSKEQHEKLLKETLIQTGKSFFESPALWFADICKIRASITNIIGEDELEQEYKKGKGIIVIIPHFGAWEMLSLVISHKYPTTTLYKPLKLKGLEEKIVNARSRLGNTLVPTTPQGVKKVYAALKNGEIIAILADQDPGEYGGVFSNFYGVPALTTTLVSKLAQKTHAPVFKLLAKRVDTGFEIIWEKANEPIDNEDLQKSVDALNQAMENCINHDITQYQWSYKKFKTRPEGETGFYNK